VLVRHCERRSPAFNMTTRHHNWQFASLPSYLIPYKMSGECLAATVLQKHQCTRQLSSCNTCLHGILLPVWHLKQLAECWLPLYQTWVLFMHPVTCVPWLVGMHCHSEKRVIASVLVNLCRWAEVQLLVNNKSLLFYASDAQTKAPKVIKYVTQYGIEVHQMLSNAGLAQILYRLVPLPGGFMQVSLAPSHIVAYFIDPNNSCHIHCPARLCGSPCVNVTCLLWLPYD